MSQTSIRKFSNLQVADSSGLADLPVTGEHSKAGLSSSQHYSSLLDTFRLKMVQNECGKIDIAVLQDPDTLRFLTGLSGVLGMSYGRPTLLIVPAEIYPPCSLKTPVCEANMARRNL